MSHEPGHTSFNSESFGLPGDYFSQSASAIMNKIEWQQEHQVFTKLLELRQVGIFSVPPNYFAKKEIQLELIEQPVLASLQTKNVFTVPASYFEEAEVRELAKVMHDEEPVLNVGRQNNFKVGDTYFETQQQRITQQLTQPKKQARVIKLFGAKTWLSAAALLLLAVGIWLYNGYVKPAEVKDCGTMACVDKDDLLKTKNLENIESDELYDIVNSKKLEKQLNNKAAVKNAEQKKVADSSDDDMPLDDLMDEI